jgi:Sulfatase
MVRQRQRRPQSRVAARRRFSKPVRLISSTRRDARFRGHPSCFVRGKRRIETRTLEATWRGREGSAARAPAPRSRCGRGCGSSGGSGTPRAAESQDRARPPRRGPTLQSGNSPVMRHALLVPYASLSQRLLSCRADMGCSTAARSHSTCSSGRSCSPARLERIDACLGRFVSFLKARGRYDNSIIVLASDHGDSLGENGRWGHAMWLFPEDVRLPLIVHAPRALQSHDFPNLARRQRKRRPAEGSSTLELASHGTTVRVR